MKSDFINPCIDCICLPTCITKYKKYECYNFPVIALKMKCKVLENIYNILPSHDNNGPILNIIDIWWRENYGQ